jgi:putative PIN family toxin of toxin-antitoxin system
LAAILADGRLIASLETATELAAVLRRSKFDRYLTAKRREELAAATIAASEMIEVTSSIRECRDLGDDKFLELALDGNAEAIVTGDSDLLALHPWRGIKILTPHAALAFFASIS